MRLSALIFSLAIAWVAAIPAQISELSKNQTAYFEAHQGLHFDAAVPEVNAGSLEPPLSLGALAPSIPLFQKARETSAKAEPHSALPALPRLHLKFRVFRN